MSEKECLICGLCDKSCPLRRVFGYSSFEEKEDKFAMAKTLSYTYNPNQLKLYLNNPPYDEKDFGLLILNALVMQYFRSDLIHPLELFVNGMASLEHERNKLNSQVEQQFKSIGQMQAYLSSSKLRLEEKMKDNDQLKLDINLCNVDVATYEFQG